MEHRVALKDVVKPCGIVPQLDIGTALIMPAGRRHSALRGCNDVEEEEAVGRCRHADAFVADEGALRNSQEVPSFLGIY